MKKKYCIPVVIALLGAAVCVGAYLTPHQLPLSQCSELYRQYSGDSHIRASFIKDFRVNDSLTLDVTILEARDSVGWDQLRIDFKRPILPPEIEKYINKHNSFAIKQVRRDDPGKGMDKENLANNDFLVIKNLERTFYLFHTDNEYKKVQIMARFTKEIYPKTDQNE